MVYGRLMPSTTIKEYISVPNEVIVNRNIASQGVRLDWIKVD